MTQIPKRRSKRLPQRRPQQPPQQPPQEAPPQAPRRRILVALLALLIGGSGIWFAYQTGNDAAPGVKSAPVGAPKETRPPVSDKLDKPDIPSTPKPAETKIESYGEKIGPFVLNNRELTFFLKYKRPSHDGVESEKTVEGFEVRDEDRRLYHQETFGTPGLDGERGSFETNIGMKVFKLEGESGEGLIVYYDIQPNDPPAGAAFQVFGLKDDKLEPLSPVISVYGSIDPLPSGGSENALRLLPGDMIQVHQSVDHLNLRIPFVVDFQKSNVRLAQSSGLFDFAIPGQNPPKEGEVPFFSDFRPGAEKEAVVLKGTEEIKFMNAYAEVRVKDDPVWNRSLAVSNLWLKVAIGEKEGWVTGKESYARLGLQGRG